MKILSKWMAAAGQVHNGKCYYIGMANGGGNGRANNIESDGTAAVGNQVGYLDGDGTNQQILPKPGIECSNGLYVDGACQIFYSM